MYRYILYLEPHFQYVGNHPVTFHFIPMNHPQLANPPFWCLEFHYMHDPFVQSLVNWSMGKPQQKVSVTRYIPIVLPHINLDPENNTIFLWKVIFRPKKLAGFTLIWGRVPGFPSCKHSMWFSERTPLVFQISVSLPQGIIKPLFSGFIIVITRFTLGDILSWNFRVWWRNLGMKILQLLGPSAPSYATLRHAIAAWSKRFCDTLGRPDRWESAGGMAWKATYCLYIVCIYIYICIIYI